jgi:diguanylate cyclase (GGDEF)-like protein/putative nucleotidyltransferase with HDIG domain
VPMNPEATEAQPWLAGVAPATVARTLVAFEAMADLPALRTSVTRLLDATADPDVSMSEVVTMIERDESLAANLLRYANSAAMARPISAATVRQAATMVGLVRVRQIALEAITYGFLERVPSGSGAARGALHLHAVAVAGVSAAVAERAGTDAETAHLAGLLHDIGKVTLPVVLSGRTSETVDGAAQERRANGIDHAQVGGLLASAWDLPPKVISAIAWHHGGPRELAGPDDVSATVQLGNGIVAMLAGRHVDHDLLVGALDELGLGLSDLESLTEQAARLASESAQDPTVARMSELERSADTDELTGLANRRAWFRRSRQALADGEHGTMLFFDLDGFKAVNDTAGHAAGDAVLSHVATALVRHGRAGRLGGDEFCLWVTGGVDEAQAAALAIIVDIRRLLEAAGLPGAGLGTSVGIAAVRGDEALEDLLARADGALYTAKNEGRGRFAVAE